MTVRHIHVIYLLVALFLHIFLLYRISAAFNIDSNCPVLRNRKFYFEQLVRVNKGNVNFFTGGSITIINLDMRIFIIYLLITLTYLKGFVHSLAKQLLFCRDCANSNCFASECHRHSSFSGIFWQYFYHKFS